MTGIIAVCDMSRDIYVRVHEFFLCHVTGIIAPLGSQQQQTGRAADQQQTFSLLFVTRGRPAKLPLRQEGNKCLWNLTCIVKDL